MTDQFRRLALAALLILGTLLAIGTFGSSSQGPSKKPFRPKLYPLSGSKGHIYPEVKYTVAPENANGKRVVITGGAGFIGSQLGWHLHNKGYEVTLIDNMRFGYADNLNVNGKQFGRFILGDVLDTRIWEYLKGADTVFHFAALSALPVCQMHPRDAMDVNVAGVANVLEGVRQMGVRRFVFASTSAVYEANKDEVLTEDLKVTPHLHYSLSKYQSELLVNAMAATYGLDVSIMRFFNVYGPHQDMRRTSPPFTSYIARELAANRVPVLHSDGKQRRDYVHVDDLMRLAMLIMESPKAKGETFNVASGKTHSVNEMFAMVKKETKATVEPVYHSAQDFWAAYKELFAGDRPIKKEILEAEVNKRTLGSFEKAKRLLGWEPKVSMEDGLRGLVQYVKEARARGVVEAPVAWKALRQKEEAKANMGKVTGKVTGKVAGKVTGKKAAAKRDRESSSDEEDLKLEDVLQTEASLHEALRLMLAKLKGTQPVFSEEDAVQPSAMALSRTPSSGPLELHLPFIGDPSTRGRLSSGSNSSMNPNEIDSLLRHPSVPFMMTRRTARTVIDVVVGAQQQLSEGPKSERCTALLYGILQALLVHCNASTQLLDLLATGDTLRACLAIADDQLNGQWATEPRHSAGGTSGVCLSPGNSGDVGGPPFGLDAGRPSLGSSLFMSPFSPTSPTSAETQRHTSSSGLGAPRRRHMHELDALEEALSQPPFTAAMREPLVDAFAMEFLLDAALPPAVCSGRFEALQTHMWQRKADFVALATASKGFAASFATKAPLRCVLNLVVFALHGPIGTRIKLYDRLASDGLMKRIRCALLAGAVVASTSYRNGVAVERTHGDNEDGLPRSAPATPRPPSPFGKRRGRKSVKPGDIPAAVAVPGDALQTVSDASDCLDVLLLLSTPGDADDSVQIPSRRGRKKDTSDLLVENVAGGAKAYCTTWALQPEVGDCVSACFDMLTVSTPHCEMIATVEALQGKAAQFLEQATVFSTSAVAQITLGVNHVLDRFRCPCVSELLAIVRAISAMCLRLDTGDLRHLAARDEVALFLKTASDDVSTWAYAFLKQLEECVVAVGLHKHVPRPATPGPNESKDASSPRALLRRLLPFFAFWRDLAPLLRPHLKVQLQRRSSQMGATPASAPASPLILSGVSSAADFGSPSGSGSAVRSPLAASPLLRRRSTWIADFGCGPGSATDTVCTMLGKVGRGVRDAAEAVVKAHGRRDTLIVAAARSAIAASEGYEFPSDTPAVAERTGDGYQWGQSQDALSPLKQIPALSAAAATETDDSNAAPPTTAAVDDDIPVLSRAASAVLRRVRSIGATLTGGGSRRDEPKPDATFDVSGLSESRSPAHLVMARSESRRQAIAGLDNAAMSRQTSLTGSMASRSLYRTPSAVSASGADFAAPDTAARLLPPRRCRTEAVELAAEAAVDKRDGRRKASAVEPAVSPAKTPSRTKRGRSSTPPPVLEKAPSARRGLLSSALAMVSPQSTSPPKK